MRALFENGYVNMPDRDNAHRVPLGETIYFLDKKGASIVAGLQGELPKDLPWRRQPRWSLISHDLAVNDFRIAVMQAVQASRALTLHRWIPESEFWALPDTVEYETAGGRRKKRRVIPDGFFTIRRPHVNNPGVMQELAFLLEIDMGTEDNPRFVREKVRPGVAYLNSEQYQERFGIDYGRWLVVTTSQIRLENMMAQTERAGGSDLFYFTTFDEISGSTVLSGTIWRPAGARKAVSLISEIEERNQIGPVQIPATRPLAAGMRLSLG